MASYSMTGGQGNQILGPKTAADGVYDDVTLHAASGKATIVAAGAIRVSLDSGTNYYTMSAGDVDEWPNVGTLYVAGDGATGDYSIVCSTVQA